VSITTIFPESVSGGQALLIAADLAAPVLAEASTGLLAAPAGFADNSRQARHAKTEVLAA
jgi:hypothetical protein